MQRDRKFDHHRGQRGGLGNSGRARVMARVLIKREWFMAPRAMRRYWGNIDNPLYGPLNSITAYLRGRRMSPRMDVVEPARRLRQLRRADLEMA